MTLKDDLAGLKGAYDKVAESIKVELPDVWAAAVRVYGGREDQIVRMLCHHNLVLGAAPLEAALESDDRRQEVLNLFSRIEYGVCI